VIQLDLSHTKDITQEEIKELAKYLSKLKNVVYLKIDFSYCPGLTIQSFEDLFLGISCMRELKSLILSA